MIVDPILFSPVFHPEKEDILFLARKKKSVSTYFKPTVERQMDNCYALALWLHIFGKDIEAVAVCNFLLQFPYNGDNSLWYHVEKAIGLKFVIEKDSGNVPEGGFEYCRLILDAEKANAKMRAGDENDPAYNQLYEGFHNGSIIEDALLLDGPEQPYTDTVSEKTDLWYSRIRELCWLIAVNEYLGRKMLSVGHEKVNTASLWDKYRMYLHEMRVLKKITIPYLHLD